MSTRACATRPPRRPDRGRDPAPRLVLAEEFDAGTLDRARWNVDGRRFTSAESSSATSTPPTPIAFARPACWLRGYGNWPDSGQTDIMEICRREGLDLGPRCTARAVPSSALQAPWRSRSTSASSTVDRAEVERDGPWRFDRPQAIVLNFAVGGIYPHGVNCVVPPYFGLPRATVT